MSGGGGGRILLYAEKGNGHIRWSRLKKQLDGYRLVIFQTNRAIRSLFSRLVLHTWPGFSSRRTESGKARPKPNLDIVYKQE